MAVNDSLQFLLGHSGNSPKRDDGASDSLRGRLGCSRAIDEGLYVGDILHVVEGAGVSVIGIDSCTSARFGIAERIGSGAMVGGVAPMLLRMTQVNLGRVRD